jgi:predicted permease
VVPGAGGAPPCCCSISSAVVAPLGISSLAGLFLGLAPAHQSTRPEVVSALKEGGGAGPRKRLNLQSGLVALQMTVSMILLVGAGLFLRSLLAAQQTDPGFSTAEAGIAWLDLDGSRLPREEWNPIRMEMEERLRAEPGVRTVTSAGRLPLSLGNSFQGFRIPGVEPPAGQTGHRLNYTEVSAGYFGAMEIGILSGREFSLDDTEEGDGVVVVSRAMANRFWPGEEPLGKEIYLGSGERPWTVVGVARDVKLHTMGEAPAPFVYFPMTQIPPHNLQLLIRGTRSQGELVSILRRVIRETDPNLLVMEVKTMDQHLQLPLFGPRAAGALLGSFGFLALLLSSIGLYGVVSFSVSRRVREMGIRMSLGARASQVVGLVVTRTLAVVAVGGLAGLAMAVVLARIIRFFLVGVSPADPLTLVSIPLLLGGVAVAAALIPARRACTVNPVEALRSE